ncbi:MAG: phosphoenolpyruvate carboxykinase (GTP) [Deltaproteobacteria bacterium]|nr:phosphoenolpyruvate carboxykinase (GTP) [Deltaproteobacteria bacterium]
MKKLDKIINLSKPDKVEIVTSYDQIHKLIDILVERNEFVKVSFQDSFWTTSHPLDVARSEESTFIVSDTGLGPYVNTVSRSEANRLIEDLYSNSMKGKTAYIVPYVMGPIGSDRKRFGITLTDSPYVVANMAILNKITLEALKNEDQAVFGFHSVAELNPKKKKILHFLDDLAVYSVNTNYGGNVLTGKKCFSLRIASFLGLREGWLAEHMLISTIQSPISERFTFLAALPSACGKTNLAMLKPPDEFENQGWKVWCVGDDIAWIFVKNGELRAFNPEYGFFGVAPGTSKKSNYYFMKSIEAGSCIFTNTALDVESMKPWWEGIGTSVPKILRNWKNEIIHNPDPSKGPFAHPNSRITIPITNCPVLHPDWNNPEGHRVDAFVFGCRRSSGMPLVFQARTWKEGVYFAATLKSERTSAQEGAVGVLRHDPFAMRPFFSYNIGAYLRHWLDIGSNLSNPPTIFFVNWFLKDGNGNFIWPGFGENLRVLEWVIKRTKNYVEGECSILGLIPRREDFNLPEGVSWEALFEIDTDDLEVELAENDVFLKALGNTCPPEMWEVHYDLINRCQR